MITIKNKASLRKMEEAGRLLAQVMRDLESRIRSGVSTLSLDAWRDQEISSKGLKSKTKGFMTYRHASCISVNDEVVHGVPSESKILKDGDVVKVDICASWEGYCADMARTFFIGTVPEEVRKFALIRELRRLVKAIDFQIFRRQFKLKSNVTVMESFVILPDMALASSCMKTLKY